MYPLTIHFVLFKKKISCSVSLPVPLFLLFLSLYVYFFLLQSWVSFLMLSEVVQVLGCAAILLSGSRVESSV